MKHTLIFLELNIFQKKLKKFTGNKNIIKNIYIIQANYSIKCEYFTLDLFFMLKSKSLLDYTNLFSPK